MWVGHFGRKKLAFFGTIPGRGVEVERGGRGVQE